MCCGMKPQGVTEEKLNRITFSFFLKDNAKDWSCLLSAGSMTTWAQMKKLFLGKFFSTSKATKSRKEIYCITQANSETLAQYWVVLQTPL